VDETLSYYAGRWPIEIFFRQCKDKLALDSYQIRSAQGIQRYWLLMSMAHFMCVAGTGEFCSFKKATTELGALSRQKSISISSNAQKKVMILMHL